MELFKDYQQKIEARNKYIKEKGDLAYINNYEEPILP